MIFNFEYTIIKFQIGENWFFILHIFFSLKKISIKKMIYKKNSKLNTILSSALPVVLVFLILCFKKEKVSKKKNKKFLILIENQ